MTQQSNSLVSVIIPCYNYAHFLGDAVESVIAQTNLNWECIIINDGSPDNTEQIALAYCKKDKRIKYLFKENGGHSSARNLGIKNCFGKYILPLDPDDKIAPGFLKNAVEVFERTPETKVVTGFTQLFGTTNEVLKLQGYDFKTLLTVNFLYNSCVYRKSDYDATNGYDETMLGFEDWDFWISLLKSGGTITELPFICYHYRKKEDSLFVEFLQDNKRVFKDLLKLYLNQIDSYEKYFSSPIELIQENEKMKKNIVAYKKSITYKLGLRIHKVKNILKG